MWIKLFEKTKSLIKSSVSFDWKKCAWIFLLFVIVGFGIILPIEYASAGIKDTLADILLSHVIAPIIGCISWIGILIAGFFVHLSAGILDAAMRPEIYNEILGKAFDVNPATNEPVGFINIAWTAVRDLVNMFFILILLVIAFGTVLRIEAYKAKNLLPKLIIAIFLVNFSKTISLIVVDFSQVFMYHLYNQIGSFDGSQRDLIGMVHDFAIGYAPWNVKVFSIAEAVGAFGACVFSFLLGFTYLALAAFMIIRLTMLCLVVVLSPAAFILLTLPSTKQYFSKWMDNLIKYSIIGPVFVFFIWLSGLMAFHLFHEAAIPPVNIPDVGGQELSGLSVAFQNIVPFGIVIFILLYSMQAAKQLGIWGAAAVDKMTVAAGIAGGFAIGRWGKGKAIAGGKRIGGRSGKILKQKIGPTWAGKWGEKGGEWLKRRAGVGGMIMDYEAKKHKEGRGEVEKYRERAHLQTDNVLDSRAKAGATSPKEVAGILEEKVRRGNLSEFMDDPNLSKKDKNRILTKAKHGGVDEDSIYNRAPSLKGEQETDPAKKQAIVNKEMERIHEEGKGHLIEKGDLEKKETMQAFQKTYDTDETEKVSKNWTKEQKESATKGIEAGFGNFSPDDVKSRTLFAKFTGELTKAFTNQAGRLDEGEAKEYIEKELSRKNAGKITKREDLELIGKHGSESKLTEISRETNDNQKKVIKEYIITNKSATDKNGKHIHDEYNFVTNNPRWRSIP